MANKKSSSADRRTNHKQKPTSPTTTTNKKPPRKRRASLNDISSTQQDVLRSYRRSSVDDTHINSKRFDSGHSSSNRLERNQDTVGLDVLDTKIEQLLKRMSLVSTLSQKYDKGSSSLWTRSLSASSLVHLEICEPKPTPEGKYKDALLC